MKFWGWAVFASVLAGCGGPGKGPQLGEGQQDSACYPNHTCNLGLSCVSNVCVVVGDAGAGSGTGGAGEGGFASSGGNSSGGTNGSGGGEPDASLGSSGGTADAGSSGRPAGCGRVQCGGVATLSGILDCGDCPAGTTCGGGGDPNQCGCTPLTCDRMGMNCGTADDGCGHPITCGTCPGSAICGGNGLPNVCSTGCSTDGWCVVHPLPTDVATPQAHQQLWGSSANDVWATVAQLGPWSSTNEPLLHFTGSKWEMVDAGNVELFGVIGFSPDDVWFSGHVPDTDGAVILHYDGTNFVPIDTASLTIGYGTLWGTSARDLWLDGKYHWDGTGWATFPGAPDDSVQTWGAAPDDVWTTNGDLYHFDGATWSNANATVTDDGGTIGIAAGSAGLVRGVSGSGADNVWLASNPVPHRKNGVWDTVPSPTPVPLAIWSDDVGSAWMLGNAPSGAEMSHWSGSDFVPVPVYSNQSQLLSLWGDRKGVVMAPGSDSVYHLANGAWSSAVQLAWNFPIASGWARSESDAWAVSVDGGSVAHFDGSAWAVVSPPITTAAVWGSSATDVWFVGTGPALHWSGAGFETATSMQGQGPVLHAISGTSASDVWAVGDGDSIPAIFHYDGANWENVVIQLTAGNPTTTVSSLSGVWAHTPDDAWSAGINKDTGHGIVLHYHGGAWHELSIPGVTDTSLAAGAFGKVWGTPAGDVWIAGSPTVGCDASDTCATYPATLDVGGGSTGPYFISSTGMIQDSAFTDLTAPGSSLTCIWGAGNSVWAAGAHQIVRKQN